MLDANFLSACIEIAIFIAFGFFVIYMKLHPSESHVDKAFKQFLETDIPSSDPRYAFNGSGEYLSFRSDGEKPVVRHVEHRIAKIVLKRDYVPPPE